MNIYTFFIISQSVHLRMRNVKKKVVEKKTHCMLKNFFLKSCYLWDNVENYCRAKQTTDENMAHVYFMLDT